MSMKYEDQLHEDITIRLFRHINGVDYFHDLDYYILKPLQKYERKDEDYFYPVKLALIWIFR